MFVSGYATAWIHVILLGIWIDRRAKRAPVTPGSSTRHGVQPRKCIATDDRGELCVLYDQHPGEHFTKDGHTFGGII